MGITDFNKEHEEFKGWCNNCKHKNSSVCNSCEQNTPTNFEEVV